jgi:hypothetical protein
MSGLNVENFNLFGKKTPSNKPALKPVATLITSPEVVEVEIKKFDAEVETPVTQMNTLTESPLNNFSVEIERFEEIRPTQVVNSEISQRPLHKEVKSVELTLKAMDKNLDDAPLRKFETFVAPTFRIPEQHDLELKKIEHFIMRNRKKGNNSDSRERITTNTVVRAMIANFLERAGDIDFSNIDNEEALKDRMEKIFKQKYSKRA